MKRLGGLVLVAVTLLIAYAALTRADRHVETLDLEQACGEVLPGDTPADVFTRLGLDAYRSGCEPGACSTASFGPHDDVPYRCEGDDCSLYWRAGDVGCLVEWRRGEPAVDGAELLRLGGPE